MPIPRVAIVGRPNAGKSSLMNMLAGAKVSIVDPTPGVTRDRVTCIVDLPHPDNKGPVKSVEFIDTGGFGVYVAEGERFDEVGADLAKLTDSIEFQIAKATEGADLILFAVDVQAGVGPRDEEIAKLLRESGIGKAAAKKEAKKRGSEGGKKGKAKSGAKFGSPTPSLPSPRGEGVPIRVVATKVDGPKWEMHAADMSSLGFGEPLMCSAKSNYFRRDFFNAIYELLPEPYGDEKKEARADLMLAIVGKRNAGKSTLVNTLAGEPRMIVSEIAGTTRDSVDVRFEMDGRSLVAIDTAGLRRKKSFQNAIEHYAFDRVQRAIDRADVLVILLDATAPISQVDEALAQQAQKTWKPVIICVNKWDLVEGTKDEKGKAVTAERYEEYIRRELRGLPFAPVSLISGETGRNVKATIDLAFELKAQSEARVTTGKLNRLVRNIMEKQGPTDTKGTFAKVFYVAQTGIAPPTITLVVNHPELFTPNYIRFLMNRFRETMPFGEVPIRIVVRERRQREDDMPGAEDGGVRVHRGRKGSDIRARKRAAETPVEGGEELLADDNSVVVDTGFEEFSGKAEDYFDEE